MKTTLTIAAIILTGLLVGAGPVASQDKGGLVKKQNSLNAEYSLAKDSAFYFVLDIIGRRLELRVRGMVLRSWPLQDMRFWGMPGFSGNVELERKSALKSPERIVIKPGEADKAEPEPAVKPASVPANPAEFELEALELKDMPKRFSLDFDNGLHITVKSKNAGKGGLIGSIRQAWKWYASLPLRNLFRSRQGRALSELELTFDNDKDAQAIYWHFFDGIKGIIL